ncbi:MAG: glycosyltransferase family 39 protein [Bacteroidota bacterium]
MKNKMTLYALAIVLLAFLAMRFSYFENNGKNGYNATSWDALGYYMYLPAELIYDDSKELAWFPAVDSAYHVSGGTFYQATPLESGTYTNKYLCGVALMELPFFYAGHTVAYLTDSPQDGFSWPYQYAILFGAIFWAAVGFIFLARVLLYFFDDRVSALTLILLGLASNLIQYAAVDGGMSHAYIFPLYALLLWFTIRWHETPRAAYALLIGLICGLAVISRPTELILIFIPILWSTHTQENKKQKWQQVFNHKSHILYCVAGGIIGILPQLLYWKYTTGSFIYDVGSKWFFLNPWFRVLFGPEKGWFLYTPVAILMVAGLFLMKNKAFGKPVLVFCLLNIWIIISWSDWKYGASYSTRALTHSYPVFALALASFVDVVLQKRKTAYLIAAGVLLIILNFYQLRIYNRGILENFSPVLQLFH